MKIPGEATALGVLHAVTGSGGSIGECGRLSQPSWLLLGAL